MAIFPKLDIIVADPKIFRRTNNQIPKKLPVPLQPIIGLQNSLIKTALKLVMCCFSTVRASIICAIGAISPPLMPCRMQKPIKELADQENPQSAEESVNAEKHQR